MLRQVTRSVLDQTWIQPRTGSSPDRTCVVRTTRCPTWLAARDGVRVRVSGSVVPVRASSCTALAVRPSAAVSLTVAWTRPDSYDGHCTVRVALVVLPVTQ